MICRKLFSLWQKRAFCLVALAKVRGRSVSCGLRADGIVVLRLYLYSLNRRVSFYIRVLGWGWVLFKLLIIVCAHFGWVCRFLYLCMCPEIGFAEQLAPNALWWTRGPVSVLELLMDRTRSPGGRLGNRCVPNGKMTVRA